MGEALFGYEYADSPYYRLERSESGVYMMKHIGATPGVLFSWIGSAMSATFVVEKKGDVVYKGDSRSRADEAYASAVASAAPSSARPYSGVSYSFCSSCGRVRYGTDRFCGGCGAKQVAP